MCTGQRETTVNAFLEQKHQERVVLKRQGGAGSPELGRNKAGETGHLVKEAGCSG